MSGFSLIAYSASTVQAKSAKDAEEFGWPGIDDMEEFCFSTQVLVLGLIHWQLTLPKAVKDKVGTVFTTLLNRTMDSHKHIIFINHNVPCGSITTEGVQVELHRGTITDCTPIANLIPEFKGCLGRTIT